MSWLDDLLQTLATCRSTLGPAGAQTHAARLAWIEHLLRAVVPEHGSTPTGQRRGGDPAKRAQHLLCRLVMEHTRDLISVFDEEGHYLYASSAHSTVLGYGPPFLVGTSSFRLVHPDDLLLANDHWRRLIEYGTAQATLRFRHASGTYRWLDLHGTIARWGGGKQIVTVARDATARVEAEAEARAGEKRFRLVVEAVRDYAICMLDPLGRVISWNGGAEQILGYRAEEIIGRHVACLYPPEQAASGVAGDVLSVAIASGESITEAVHVRKDGRRIDVRDVVTSIYANGVLRGFDKITCAIGEQQRIDAENREAAARYRALLRAVGDAIYCVGRDGIVREQLATGEVPHDRDSTAVAGQHLRDLFPDIAEVLMPLLVSSIDPDAPSAAVPVLTCGSDGDRAYEWRVVPSTSDHVLLVCRATGITHAVQATQSGS
jgi:PAS domain S-box-containing protein